MRFLVDAQLPVRLAQALELAGHDVLHTALLIHGNRTTDAELSLLADVGDWVVVTKDRDFEVSHLVSRSPRRLLLTTTGNIANNELLQLVIHNLSLVEQAFNDSDFVELSSTEVIGRGRPSGA